MGTAKLMTPLFYDGNYNVEKKRMRAVLEREVSNGAVSYRLWRSDGKPDLEYPRAANDAYILHVEVNDHLVPLRMTDYALVNHCGLLPATIDDAFLQEAAQGEYCFVEDAPLAPFEKWIERIVIFRWNRTYPADRYFDLQLGSGQWHLVGTSEFAGHSHDLITMEVYER